MEMEAPKKALLELNMKLTYQKLNAIITKMAQSMKSNGECNLSSNSLMDRFAKAANYKSRQEMKSTIKKEEAKAIEGFGTLLVESYREVLTPKSNDTTHNSEIFSDSIHLIRLELSQYMAKEYVDLLYREDYKRHMEEHGSNGIELYENYLFECHCDSFLMDSRGLFFKELSFEKLNESGKKTEILFEYSKKHISSESSLNTDELDLRRVNNLESLLWQMVKTDLCSKIEGKLFELNQIASAYLHENKECSNKEILSEKLYPIIATVI